MKGLGLYEDESEQRQHLSAIQMIVRDAGFSEEKVHSLYEHILLEFKNDVKVKTYLTILVSKKVKQILARGE